MAAGVAIVAVVAVGCTDPSKDYDDFQTRIGSLTDSSTADTGGDAAPEVSRDGSIFDEAGVASFSGEFWSVCLDKSYAGDISAAVSDHFHFEFVANADGTVSVSGNRQALTLGATNISQTVGDPTTIPSVPVDVNGAFSAHVATFITPKAANVFGFDLVVENGLYTLQATSPNTVCGHFTANVTSPIPQDVDETCVMQRPAADGSFVPLTTADSIHCP